MQLVGFQHPCTAGKFCVKPCTVYISCVFHRQFSFPAWPAQMMRTRCCFAWCVAPNTQIQNCARIWSLQIFGALFGAVPLQWKINSGVEQEAATNNQKIPVFPSSDFCATVAFLSSLFWWCANDLKHFFEVLNFFLALNCVSLLHCL